MNGVVAGSLYTFGAFFALLAVVLLVEAGRIEVQPLDGSGLEKFLNQAFGCASASLAALLLLIGVTVHAARVGRAGDAARE